MREIKKWCTSITEALGKSDDLKNYVSANFDSLDAQGQKWEISKIARLIADVELGLTLLHLVAPEHPATCGEALLSGFRFPVPELEEQNWRLVQNARFYLVRRKGKQWKRSLERYIGIDQILTIYRLSESGHVPQLTASSTAPRRFETYRKTLQTTPKHQLPDIKLATEGLWYAKVTQQGHGAVNVPIYISQQIANIAPTSNVSLVKTRSARNPSTDVSLDELLISAQEMDSLLAECKHKAENYYQRLQRILIELYDADIDKFRQAREFKIDKIIHIVGLLNVGKTTLLEVLIYHLTKQKHRCALIVNDVAAAVRIASMFAHQLGIPAVPILGYSERADQLVKAYKSILEKSGDEITKGAVHSAWRWFSPICPLLSLVESDHSWEFGSEPCHNLYPSKEMDMDSDSQSKITTPNQVGQLDRTDELEEWDFIDHKKGRTCPFYYKCPRHQLERDISQAYVWVLTSASFIHTRVPSQGFEQKILIAEAVYRECNFLFIDEADRVQIQFDEAFAPSEVLLDDTQDSLLNQLGVKTAPLYNSNRSLMAHQVYRTWMSLQYMIQNAANHICEQLYNNQTLVYWLGTQPFTGYFLFAQIIRSLTGSGFAEITDENNRIKRQRKQAENLLKTLDRFIQDPMNRKEGKDLTDLANTILSSQSNHLTLIEIDKWLSEWLSSNKLSLPDKINKQDLISKIHLTILVVVLDNQLGDLVDNIRQLSQTRIVDLHDINQPLIHRPPLDYLPVIPQAPVGNILGFRYIANKGKKGGKLEYFRYVGIGRTLLLRFPTLFAIDGLDGAHTVLISGTSYAPGSPAYHVRVKPTVLLRPALSDDGIAKSEFSFSPRPNSNGDHIAISGQPSELRQTFVESMIKSISQSTKRSQRNSFLDGIFDRLRELENENPCWWSDRKRILIIVGSYVESEMAADILRREYTIEPSDESSDEGIKTLRRDNAPVHKYGIPRSQIQEQYSEITIAPLMALERGHNILNPGGKAAFGAVLFLNRPMPVPDDWQATVRQLNDWAIVNESNSNLYSALVGKPLTLPTASLYFYQSAVKKMKELNTIPMKYAALTNDERSVLCSTQMVRIWQIIGRLVRGGVPCLVYFMDVKFAPKSAIYEKDTANTSLLVGIVNELDSYMNASDYASKTLAESLYGAFLTSLKHTDNLKES